MIAISKTESWSLDRKRGFSFVALSILLQLPLAFFLGHYYDQRISMATGYQVSLGADPYNPIDLVNIFPNNLLNGSVPSIGYPPPWPLILGFIYRFSYVFVPNIFVYNFATKVPIIIANIALAYLVRNFLLSNEVDRKKAHGAWLFLLFNPFLILTTSAWGQIDSVAALLFVGFLFELSRNFPKTSGFLLGTSIAIKPIALPLAPLPLLLTERRTFRRSLGFSLALLATLLALWVLPLFLFGWSQIACLACTAGRFEMAGGMTVFNVAEIIQNSPMIPPSLWFLAYLWVPALVVGYYYVYRNPPQTTGDFVCVSIGLSLIFFLTRSWLSEPNVNLILPLVLIAVALNRMDKRSLHLVWIVTLVFMVANAAFPQLFFLVYPSVLDSIGQFDSQFGALRLAVRFAIAVIWFIVAWNIAIQMMKAPKKRESTIADSVCSA